jgi:hypothetical protein
LDCSTAGLTELFKATPENIVSHTTTPIAAAAIGAAAIICHECHSRKGFASVPWETEAKLESLPMADAAAPLFGAETGGLAVGPLDGGDWDVPSGKGWTAGVSGGLGGCQPSGGVTGTMHPHFGHSRIAPTASALRTASRTRQVGQVMVNNACCTIQSTIG